ncbi:MAG: hypothetical protein ACPGWR_19975 [Ardenticatenaceae bacterium]
MTRRKRLLDELRQSSSQEPWGESAELCFKILYGLPPDLQIRLACFMMRRYLPIFEFKNHRVKWPRRLLNHIAQWATTHGREVPEEPENADAADAAFLYCFDALLLACAYPNDASTLTSSCVVGVDSAINARETNTWIYDDPEAYQMWEQGELLAGRSALENPGAIALSKREWRLVAQWLEQEEVWRYPDESDFEQIEEQLSRWMEREMLLTVPKEELALLKEKSERLYQKSMTKTSESVLKRVA